jgi:hypothetical protein
MPTQVGAPNTQSLFCLLIPSQPQTLHQRASTKSKAASSSDSRKASFLSLTDTALTMATKQLTFSPAWTEPLSNLITPESRIRQLREMLLDKSLEFQKENILLAIHLYETGELPPKRAWETTWILNGKAVSQLPNETPMNSVVWAEVCLTSILYYYLLTRFLVPLLFTAYADHSDTAGITS